MSGALLAIIVYLVAQFGIALWVSRRVRDEADFFLAGRKLGPWLASFTVFATWFGAETCIGAAGEAYRAGLPAVAGDPLGYALGLAAAGLFFAAALWRRGLLTLADLFRQRFGGGVERLTALVMLPTSLLWAAAQLRALGQVLDATGDVGILLAITVSAVVVIGYTAIGGMWADAWTDLVQGGVLILGLVVLAVAVLFWSGPPEFAWRGAVEPGAGPRRPLVEIFALTLFGTIAAQELVSRMLAARSPELARGATMAGAGVYLFAGVLPVLVGLAAAAHVGLEVDPEQVLAKVAEQVLPWPLYVLFLGALVSAILSTLSGTLLVASALATHNLLQPLHAALGRPDPSPKAKLRLHRLAVIALGVIAWGLALASDGIYALVEMASGLGSAGLFVLMVAALWAPRFGGAPSAIAAVLASMGSFIVLDLLLDHDYSYLVSLAAAVLAYLLCLPWRPAAAVRAQGASPS
jgi:Na+/proline symporter